MMCWNPFVRAAKNVGKDEHGGESFPEGVLPVRKSIEILAGNPILPIAILSIKVIGKLTAFYIHKPCTPFFSIHEKIEGFDLAACKNRLAMFVDG